MSSNTLLPLTVIMIGKESYLPTQRNILEDAE